MRPTRTLNKIKVAAVAPAVAVVVLALVRAYLWTDMPIALEGPMNTLILAGVVAAASGISGWLTPIAPGEIKQVDKASIEAKHGTIV